MYIHIGAHKTGTTALQRFLSSNRGTLQKKGYLYPGSGEAHHYIPHSLQNNTRIYADPHALKKAAFDEMDSSDLSTVILSSEDFEYLGRSKILLLRDMLEGRYSPRIVMYVRRQDDLIISRYNQKVKGPARYPEKLSTFVASSPHEKDRIDPYRVLAPWREAFGLESITVRVYEKEQLPEGIFSDFLKSVGLEMDGTYEIPHDLVNKSLSWDLIDIIRRCNLVMRKHPHTRLLFLPLIRVLERVDLPGEHSVTGLLSPRERRALIGQYDKSNSMVAREYLSRADGVLFYAPLPDPEESWDRYPGLTLRKLLSILVRLPYASAELVLETAALKRDAGDRH